MLCFHHNKDLIFCSYCFSIINNYNNNRLICPICRNTLDLVIICFLCNNSYNIYYANEYCKYYSYSANIIKKWFKFYILKKKIIKYANYILDDYYKPTSKYIEYIVNNFDNENENIDPNNKLIAYINKNNVLKFLKIII